MFFLLNELRNPESKDIPITTSTCSAQLLISSIILQWKEPRLLEKMAESRTEAEGLQVESGASYSARK